MIGKPASDNGLEFVFVLDNDMLSDYKSDPVSINQIFLNLISNAIKYTENGSFIVKFQPTAIGNPIEGITFSITDTGIGLSELQQETLFERFTQAEISTTRKYGVQDWDYLSQNCYVNSWVEQ
jgi:signal transduction histidine kinase